MDLRVQRLDVRLGKADIIRDISLHVRGGQFVGLIGPNGCGKSTLLKSVYKVIHPQGGEVLLGDMDVLSEKPRRVSRNMAVVGQFNDLSFGFSVREMVLMGRTPHKKPMEGDNAEDLRLADEALGMVELADYADREFLTLSGGERQRVILARAIVQQPKFLILDEPTNHLDIKYQIQILSIVRGLGIGTLAALHDLSLAAAYCDYLYMVKRGRVVAHGAPRDVITKELIESVYEVRCETYNNPVTGALSIAYLPA